MAIPSQSFLPEERCHWLDIGVSPDVLILDVVLLGLASSPSQPFHISVVQFSCKLSFFLSASKNILLKLQVPFREAHSVSGSCVALAEKNGVTLSELTPAQFKTVK